jgi:feruloyl esterase
MKTCSFRKVLVGIALSVLFFTLNTGMAAAASCESLGSLSLPNATITSAAIVEAGAFTPPDTERGPARANPYKKLPAFCRVQLTLKPTADSDIKTEVWLPISGWNGKLQAVGNGGWAGNISYNAFATPLAAGYATVGSDTGHTGHDAEFAVGHPEKLVDFGPRSVHEMTVKAKALIQAFFGSAPKRSYFVSCSTGGRQALQAAQRHPEDFDGIVAGDPVNNWSNVQSATIMWSFATKKDPATRLGPEHFTLLNKAAIAKCDPLDGLTDGIISDPLNCPFDPAVLLCKDGATTGCLTAAQVEAVKKVYSPSINPRTKQEFYPRLLPGSEQRWNDKIGGGPEPFLAAATYFKNVIFKDPNWDWKTFDFGKDVDYAAKVDNNNLNAIDPNLKPFLAHGGKLIQYHGWADSSITPQDSINYYHSVAKLMGGPKSVSSWYRLFMVPGMNHCSGGPGTDKFDMAAALDEWVEKGVAPDSIPAAHMTEGKVDRTRPLCPYPQTALYKGSGSTDDAANFVCK